ncbi:hypothetical protein [Salinispora tropica]|uniref:hypothetical protein n=1 Tax=Salinispora tropica TaxID=168695 RepID=UPI0003602DB3|nr:hypothetical protein [Salinispora tropica]
MKFSNAWTEIAVIAVLTAIGMALVGLAFDIDYTSLVISYMIVMAATVAAKLTKVRRTDRN